MIEAITIDDWGHLPLDWIVQICVLEQNEKLKCISSMLHFFFSDFFWVCRNFNRHDWKIKGIHSITNNDSNAIEPKLLHRIYYHKWNSFIEYHSTFLVKYAIRCPPWLSTTPIPTLEGSHSTSNICVKSKRINIRSVTNIFLSLSKLAWATSSQWKKFTL